MKRVIKFRCPHFGNVTKKFEYFTYWGRIDQKGNPSNDCFTSPSTSSHTTRGEDQQFTRLHDKNGREIYEGDICDSGNGNLAPITFNNGGFEWHGEPLGWNFEPDEDYKPTVFDTTKWCEVKGNIYEHPELLTPKPMGEDKVSNQ